MNLTSDRSASETLDASTLSVQQKHELAEKIGSIARDLGKGMSGEDVLILQKALVLLGYLKVTPNENFGPATEDALVRFKIDHKLATDKNQESAKRFGANTKNKMQEILSTVDLDVDVAALLNQALLLSDEPLKQKMAEAQDRMKRAEQTKAMAEHTKSAIEQVDFGNGDLFDARAMYLWIKDEAKSHGKSLPSDFSSTGEKTLQLFTALSLLESRLHGGKPSENASADVKASYERGAVAARNTITSGSQPIIQRFFQQMKGVAQDVFGKSIEQAELNRLSALSDTEAGERLAEKHGLHIKVKAAPDSLETSKEVFEREALKMLMNGPEFKDEEARKDEVCREWRVKTPRDLDEKIPDIRKRLNDITKYTEEGRRDRNALEKVLEVHAAYPLLEYEKTVILPALARMYADRIAAYAVKTYPNDVAKQRLFFEASKKHVRHPFFADWSKGNEEPTQYIGKGYTQDPLNNGNQPRYTFSIEPQSAGLPSEDQDFLNGEWLRVRALRGVLISSRADLSEKDNHKSQNDVYGGIAAVDQYLGYRGKRINTNNKNNFLGGKGYFSIDRINHSLPQAVDHHLYKEPYSEGKGRNDTDTLTQTDPTFAHDVMAIQAMEKQILGGLPTEDQQVFINYDWTPVFKPLFDYIAPDGTIYASGKREEQQAHFNQMKTFLASFDKGGKNALLQERRRIATIEDATILTEEYRLRALGVAAELDGVQGQLEDLNKSLATEKGSVQGAAEKVQTLAQRIEQLQKDLQTEKSGKESAERALAEFQESSRIRDAQAQSQMGSQLGSISSLEAQDIVEKGRVAGIKREALAALKSLENASGILDSKKRAEHIATLRAKLTEI
ncbi:MAG: peptidoglycan-binding protein [Candidatus Gracilibacteria bacterium]